MGEWLDSVNTGLLGGALAVLMISILAKTCRYYTPNREILLARLKETKPGILGFNVGISIFAGMILWLYGSFGIGLLVSNWIVAAQPTGVHLFILNPTIGFFVFPNLFLGIAISLYLTFALFKRRQNRRFLRMLLFYYTRDRVDWRKVGKRIGRPIVVICLPLVLSGLVTFLEVDGEVWTYRAHLSLDADVRDLREVTRILHLDKNRAPAGNVIEENRIVLVFEDDNLIDSGSYDVSFSDDGFERLLRHVANISGVQVEHLPNVVDLN